MNTLEYVLNKFNLGPDTEYPVKLVFKRYDLAGMFKDLGFKAGAEIGVHTGEFSEVLCMQNPGVKLYCIDPWQVYDSDEHEEYSHDQASLDKFYREAELRLSKYNCQIVRKTSIEAVKKFGAQSLDFVYIDANHSYKNVAEDIDSWSGIVRAGGIVSGHDYGHYKHRDRNLGSKRAIDEYVAKHGKKLFLVNRNYQTTWFFVK